MGVRPVSLKGRALAYLARREHSRLELERKLAPHAESPEQLERVLDELEHAKLLSAERFAQSLVYRRADRFGTARIRAELKQHQLAPDVVSAQTQNLQATELERAREVWQRRFGHIAASPAERAKQMRFLAARGFSAEAIRHAVTGAHVDDEFLSE
ncbi:MAG TPA: recombination regulator RecX [Burkholderiaceae bacterium]|nr:recombination regulator RecX [Burkholderiaceae bacterium]